MKKFFSFLLAISIITGGIAAFAEPLETDVQTEETTVTETAAPAETETPAPEETAAPTPRPPERELSTEVTLDIYVMQHKYIISKNLVIELYDMNDKLLGSELRYVGWDTPSVSMTFTVPEYRMGEQFKIKLVEGARSLWYYDQMLQIGDTTTIQTYGYIDDDGNYVQSNGASIAINPHYEKEIHLYITNKWYNDITPRARVIDDVTMAPVRDVAEAMGLTVKYITDSDSVICSLEDKVAQFWANNEYMTYPDGNKNAQHPPVYVDGSLFVPVRDLAEAFGCSLEVTDYGEFIDILIGEAPYIQEIRNRIPVNKNGIGSRTNYLVWVSKHEYKVRVYQGQQYHWSLMKEFPCALGAWATPTITGQFEYIERTRWDYGSYYVAPVLRFYNGYALHSTLLSYGGGEYDGRVGVNISHGCVRLHPQDINWIASTIPFRTRIYITE